MAILAEIGKILDEEPNVILLRKDFNPNTQRHLGPSLYQCYIANEKTKKRSPGERLLVAKNRIFSPLLFNCFNGMSREYFHCLRRLLTGMRRDERLYWYEQKLFFYSKIFFGATNHHYYDYRLNIILCDILMLSILYKTLVRR